MPNCVCKPLCDVWQIVGQPSAKLMTEMSETEKKRVAEQRTALGEEGRKIKRQRLEKATQDNEVRPPSFFFFNLLGGDLSVHGMQDVYELNGLVVIFLEEKSHFNY